MYVGFTVGPQWEGDIQRIDSITERLNVTELSLSLWIDIS